MAYSPKKTLGSIFKSVKKWFLSVKKRVLSFMSRRPHRSFRRTRRRDYNRPLGLPGYFSFSNYVIKTIWSARRLLGSAVLIYVVATALIVGIASQESYASLSDTVKSTGTDVVEGGLGRVGESFLILAGTISGNVNGAITPEAQAYSGIITFLFWLTVVYILRSVLAKRKIKLRDALYNSGAPIVPTMLVSLVIVFQLFPIAIAIIAYAAASQSGMLSGGVEAMMVWLAILLLSVLSLYWIVVTLIALAVVTLPGMYPYQAIKAAGDLVVGRRFRILLRLVWMTLGVLIAWSLIMVPVIIFDDWIKSVLPIIDWMPIVPIVVLVLSSLSVLVFASYLYLMYRKIVEDDSKPA